MLMNLHSECSILGENFPLHSATTCTKYDYWPQNGLGNFPSTNEETPLQPTLYGKNKNGATLYSMYGLAEVHYSIIINIWEEPHRFG